ncbi:hypothetical protein WOLCODRAFT_153005 [Wolfiporia cocos MD-104 SS10]|uniref:Uncharacterized protein n=1 Tax=Wolfiporia cocos (strain MD-104) TaxID=742152 RepID=A0A2H3K1Q0_WOLCO|nr:hypothetical protein WOLCODRAFT_153005 [Wolfiporia cocos MD-104 SS10]
MLGVPRGAGLATRTEGGEVSVAGEKGTGDRPRREARALAFAGAGDEGEIRGEVNKTAEEALRVCGGRDPSGRRPGTARHVCPYSARCPSGLVHSLPSARRPGLRRMMASTSPSATRDAASPQPCPGASPRARPTSSGQRPTRRRPARLPGPRSPSNAHTAQRASSSGTAPRHQRRPQNNGCNLPDHHRARLGGRARRGLIARPQPPPVPTLARTSMIDGDAAADASHRSSAASRVPGPPERPTEISSQFKSPARWPAEDATIPTPHSQLRWMLAMATPMAAAASSACCGQWQRPPD